ncbi:hypothetical protein NADFUDRAFT_57500 [Nadsonia fulvescens var. elongata DSM 6958]|uniref:Dol-P-Glc:Glc(2)Man(9)GlcNAc(2)-PP-Dol alpha-1,2-glucosyltransferase n=1 Tax=Nadsonia fulvescens var. elongata DSM 6958 TaxID=857566 RepID=A0A1E3PMG0_9ASCO|nr:hypothetical protein NADFUDRAFT_57500 [Nadsonia fulvescens var. elongata DSM 6958]
MFLLVNVKVQMPYIDEIFHIPQTQRYCDEDYYSWDPKITTPPGLYLLGVLYSKLISSLHWMFSFSDTLYCTIPVLRSLNFIGAVIVFPLILSFHPRSGLDFSPVSLGVFPLMAFFSSLYYTDVWSTNILLLSLVIGLRAKKSSSRILLSAILAAFSVTFRQTNIVWVGFNLITILDDSFIPKHISNPLLRLKALLYTFLTLKPHTRLLIFSYGAIAAMFAIFLRINGSITLGDKSNHVSALHIPQIFYFSIFTTFFSWPTWLSFNYLRIYIDDNFNLSKNRYSILRVLLTGLSLSFIAYIQLNYAIEHPFLIADNRHYTFYIWRRLIRPALGLRDDFSSNRSKSLAYLVVICLLTHFSLWNMWTKLCNSKSSANVNTILALLGSVIITLAPSPLFEPRYYIIPYIIWRLSIGTATNHSKYNARLLAEWWWYMIINITTGYFFLMYPFEWASEPGIIQRFMW